MEIIIVMFGGFLGAIFRWWIGTWSILKNNQLFPFPTLLVNLIGSLLLGWFIAKYKERYPKLFLFFGTGLIGSFTTFSTFSVETLSLIEKGKLGFAFVYILLSMFLGVSFAFLGYKLAQPSKEKVS